MKTTEINPAFIKVFPGPTAYAVRNGCVLVDGPRHPNGQRGKLIRIPEHRVTIGRNRFGVYIITHVEESLIEEMAGKVNFQRDTRDPSEYIGFYAGLREAHREDMERERAWRCCKSRMRGEYEPG